MREGRSSPDYSWPKERETAHSAQRLALAAQVGDVADFWLGEANQRIEAVLKEAGGAK